MQAAAKARTVATKEAKAARGSVSLETTSRATRVLGQKVIDSSTAVILGFVDELYFHLETQQMVAIRVRAGFKARFLARLKGKRSRWVVPIHLVHSIGPYAVVVDRERAAIPTNPSAPGEAEKKTRPQQKPPTGSSTLHALIGQAVVNDTGELLGKLLDVVLDDAGTTMQQFELDARHAFNPRSKRRLISAQTRALGDVLLVPAYERQPALPPSAPAPAIAAPAAEPFQSAAESLDFDAPEWLC
ncbi:MAG TPA: PRC-barrel domain-containing protein [Ktedonobacterales bacterium]|jgi:sporulation protein YlmC with PRC-barrel domain